MGKVKVIPLMISSNSEDQQETKKMKNGAGGTTAATSGAVIDGNQWSQYQQQWTYSYNTQVRCPLIHSGNCVIVPLAIAT